MKRLFAVMVLLAGVAAYGEDPPAGGFNTEGNVRYNKTTSINFEDDTIEGDLTKPDGEYVEARKKVKHSNLIRIREEFKDQVMESVGEL
jgi:hypothetical protein